MYSVELSDCVFMDVHRSQITTHMNTKLFWKTYWEDKERLRFMAIALLILAIFLALVSKNTAFVITVCLGYIVNDPLSYYLINYRKNNK